MKGSLGLGQKEKHTNILKEEAREEKEIETERERERRTRTQRGVEIDKKPKRWTRDERIGAYCRAVGSIQTLARFGLFGLVWFGLLNQAHLSQACAAAAAAAAAAASPEAQVSVWLSLAPSILQEYTTPQGQMHCNGGLPLPDATGIYTWPAHDPEGGTIWPFLFPLPC